MHCPYPHTCPTLLVQRHSAAQRGRGGGVDGFTAGGAFTQDARWAWDAA